MPKKIKIALMSDAMDRRPERSITSRRLVENLLKHSELEIYLIHFQKMPDDPLYRRVHEIVIPLLPLPWASHFFSFLWFCLKTKEKFDIFQWMVARPYPFFWLVPSKKIVVTAHDGYVDLWTVPNTFFWAMLRFFHHYIGAIIGVSEFASKEIIYTYHVRPEKVFTIYNGMDPIFRHIPENEARRIVGKYSADIGRYFIYVGGLQPHKNVKRIVESYILLRDTIDIKEKLLIIGKSSYGAKEVHSLAESSRYSKDILFINYMPLEDLPAFYSAAIALVFPSLNEGFGLPIIESMGCGTPVITSNILAMPEAAGGAALLVNPYNAADIMEAMKRISGDELLRRELSEKGVEYAKAFSWDKYAEDNLAVYMTLLTNK